MKIFRALFSSCEDSADLFFESVNEDPVRFMNAINSAILNTLRIHQKDEPRRLYCTYDIFDWTPSHDYKRIFIDIMISCGYMLIEVERKNTVNIDSWQHIAAADLDKDIVLYDED